MALTCGAGGSNGQEIVTAINLNTDGVADLVTALGALTTRVDTIEDNQVSNYDSNSNILDIGTTIVPIVALNVTAMPAGIYFVGWSTTHTFDVTNVSVEHEMILNGGTPEILREENKDITDRDIESYPFIVEHQLGDFSLTLGMRKDGGAGTLDVQFGNMWAFRIGDLPTP